MRPMALKTSLKIQLRYDPFMSMSCHLSEVVTAPSQNGIEGIFYLVLESRLIGLTVWLVLFKSMDSRISFYTLAKSGRPTESHCWWEEGLRGNESWNTLKYIEILGSELLVLLLLLVRHCLSQWVLIFRRGHGLEVKSVELTEVSATPVGVTGRFPREFRDVEMKRWRLGFLEGKDNPLEGVPW
jgi:hypothetical protein